MDILALSTITWIHVIYFHEVAFTPLKKTVITENMKYNKNK